jgi:LytS/YehU family sensor histidine kinase
VLLLQPIIENAVGHGMDAGLASLNLRIDALETPLGVELMVDNDGNMLRENGGRASGHGVGLAATRARLATAYGGRASFSLLPRGEGGVSVRIAIPRKTATPLAPSGARLQETT